MSYDLHRKLTRRGLCWDVDCVLLKSASIVLIEIFCNVESSLTFSLLSYFNAGLKRYPYIV